MQRIVWFMILFFIITSSFVIHETAHAIQFTLAGYEVDEIAFIGLNFNYNPSTAVGWVKAHLVESSPTSSQFSPSTSTSPSSEPMKYSEEIAYSLQIIYIIALTFIFRDHLFFRRGKLIYMKSANSNKGDFTPTLSPPPSEEKWDC